MYYINLLYNICVLEPLGHKLLTKMDANALKIILHMLVYSNFISFIVSF
jgi:hypothetical protein